MAYPNAMFSPNLGLSLTGMHSQEAIEDFLILDTAYGAGSSINVNGTLVTAPNLNNTTPTAPGGSANITWQVDGNGNISAYSTGGGGSGTVTSVGLTGDGVIFSSSVTGSPITTSGTLVPTLIAQAAATFLAGPASGGNATPTFRAIAATDVPTLNQNTTGTAANLSGTPTLPNGTAATTQTAGDTSTAIATDAFVAAAIAAYTPPATLWSALGNATGNLTLANGTHTTTFNQTSNVAWLWANTTTGTSITTNASPLLELSSQYYTGSATGTDLWTIGSALAAGTNGNSTLVIAHSGSTGTAAVQFPAGSLGTSSLQVGASGAGLSFASNVLSLNGGSGGLYLYQGATNFGAFLYSTTTMMLRNNTAGPIALSGAVSTAVAATTGFAVYLNNGSEGISSFTGTSGTQGGVSIGASAGSGNLTFAPTSGTCSFVGLQVNPTINQTSSASGSYTGLLVNVVETALLGTSNKLLDLQAGTTGGTSQFSITNKGTVSKYNAIATVGNGVPAEYAASDLTAQSAAIAATTLYATTATGMYRVSWSATITTADGVSSVLGGTNGFQVLYTSPTDSVVKTTVAGNSVTSSANTTGTAVGGCEVIYAKTGTNIQFQYGYTSATPGQMVYEIHCKVESL